ncbi:MAG: type III-A CRISPR-associated RAMP protein Csm3 [Anaerobutyricum sp.]|nr:type III-A CRISPR-associated RAMP protein Csm3 [Anaerobutyricum sp.]
MFAKVEITGTIRSLTGMHIGGSTQFAAIGAVDSPVIRDVFTDQPMIPGSSLKGKMRYLLSKQYNDKTKMRQTPNDDDPRILRLFGSSEKNNVKRSRLIFSDMSMSNVEELQRQGVSSTEVKFENTINRLTAVANPRQIERAVRGGKYNLDLIYNVEEPEEMVEDIRMLCDGFRLLKYDYIGGHGSRGYGKIEFSNLEIDCVIGEVVPELMEQCQKLLKEVGE